MISVTLVLKFDVNIRAQMYTLRHPLDTTRHQPPFPFRGFPMNDAAAADKPSFSPVPDKELLSCGTLS